MVQHSGTWHGARDFQCSYARVSGSLGSFVVHESHTHKIPLTQSQDTAFNTHNLQACDALIESTAGKSVEQHRLWLLGTERTYLDKATTEWKLSALASRSTYPCLCGRRTCCEGIRPPLFSRSESKARSLFSQSTSTCLYYTCFNKGSWGTQSPSSKMNQVLEHLDKPDVLVPAGCCTNLLRSKSAARVCHTMRLPHQNAYQAV